jgi:putative phosphoribosyl transferase
MARDYGLNSSSAIERRELRDRIDLFADRGEAGAVLADMLREAALPRSLVLAIPAGGVPVAVSVATALGWPLDVAVVSKITLPWNTEAGYGAVAFDGSVLLNDALIRVCALSVTDVERGIAVTQRKVQQRVTRLRSGCKPLELAGEAVILVDDGLASGFTMAAAIAACRNAGARRISVAVPTAHADAIERILASADAVVCANVRGSTPFAVADAYLTWCDVVEASAELLLEKFRAASAQR